MVKFKIITNDGVEFYKSIECYDYLDDDKVKGFASGVDECGIEVTSFGNDTNYDFVILRDFSEQELYAVTKDDWKKIQIAAKKISLENRDYSDGGSGVWEDSASQEELEVVYRFD